MQIILATGNAHKAEEFSALFAARGLPVTVHAASKFGGMPHVPEDTGTFDGNARQKARALRAIVPAPFWIMSDDSGLACDALAGDPGVESANYAGPKAPDAANRAKLLDALAGVPDEKRTAHFICNLILITPSGEEHAFIGKCPGKIIREETGTGGFGYDPLFAPEEIVGEKTFAQLDAETKNRLSHRGRAFAKLADWIEKNLPELQ